MIHNNSVAVRVREQREKREDRGEREERKRESNKYSALVPPPGYAPVQQSQFTTEHV